MTPRLLEFTSSGPVGSLICGVEDGVVRGVVWLVVAPQPMAAKALNRIMFRIKDMAESSAIDRSNAGAVEGYGWGVVGRWCAWSSWRTSSSEVWSKFRYHSP